MKSTHHTIHINVSLPFQFIFFDMMKRWKIFSQFYYFLWIYCEYVISTVSTYYTYNKDFSDLSILCVCVCLYILYKMQWCIHPCVYYYFLLKSSARLLQAFGVSLVWRIFQRLSLFHIVHDSVAVAFFYCYSYNICITHITYIVSAMLFDIGEYLWG